MLKFKSLISIALRKKNLLSELYRDTLVLVKKMLFFNILKLCF